MRLRKNKVALKMEMLRMEPKNSFSFALPALLFMLMMGGFFAYNWGDTNCTVGSSGANTTITNSVSNGSCYFNLTSTQTIMYLIVAGGGGGGQQIGGGGGGGGFLHNEAFLTGIANFTLTTGAGGFGSIDNSHRGYNGTNSTIYNTTLTWISAAGGGGGGSELVANGENHGTGGGGAYNGGVKGNGTAGQGFNGGDGTSSPRATGGGGGAGAAGVSGASTGGDGGAGNNSGISGSTIMYSCGGGGAGSAASSSGAPGAAGCSSSGVGGSSTLVTNGGNAQANRGGGGGGGDITGSVGGNASSGIIIINFLPNVGNTTSVNYSGPAPTSSFYYANITYNFSGSGNTSSGNVTSLGLRIFYNGTLMGSLTTNYTCLGSPASCANNTNYSIRNLTIADNYTKGTNITPELTAFSSTNFANSNATNGTNITINDSQPTVDLMPAWMNGTGSYGYGFFTINCTTLDGDGGADIQTFNISVNSSLTTYPISNGTNGIRAWQLFNITNATGKANYKAICGFTDKSGLYAESQPNSNQTPANQITLKTDLSFVNSSAGHSFTATTTMTESTGNGSDIITWTINNTFGTCNLGSGFPSGADYIFTFNCSITTPQNDSVFINASDPSPASNVTSNKANFYPDHAAALTAPTISPASPTQSDLLNCSAGTFSDTDSDTENISARTWAWLQNGTAIPGKTGTTLQLNNTNYSIGDNISCSEFATNSTWWQSNVTKSSANVTVTSSALAGAGGGSVGSTYIPSLNNQTNETNETATTMEPATEAPPDLLMVFVITALLLFIIILAVSSKR